MPMKHKQLKKNFKFNFIQMNISLTKRNTKTLLLWIYNIITVK